MPRLCKHIDEWKSGEYNKLPGKLSAEESIPLFHQHVEWLKLRNGTSPDLSQITYHGDLSTWDFREARLETADLRGALLEKANFQGAHLDKARLESTHLEGANLSGSHLREANLECAHLEQAILDGAHLEKARLAGAHLDMANLHKAVLIEADLRYAHLQKATIYAAHLEKANLGKANLEEADLSASHLNGAALWGANLTRANLSRVTGLLLDSTVVRHARFSPWAQDPWSVLRRNYTGGKFLFHLLFMVSFILIYAAKVMFWVGINHAQVALVSVQTQTNADLEKLANELKSQGERLQQQSAALAFPMLKQLTDDLSKNLHVRLEPCLAEKCVQQSVLAALVRWHEDWPFWLTALAIITYNILRGVLTWIMTPLRDEEERSGHTPPYRFETRGKTQPLSHYVWLWFKARREVYGWLIFCHRWIVRPLLVIAVGSLMFHGWDILFNTDVWLPRR